MKIDKTDRVDWWCTIELEARTGESTSSSPTCLGKRNKASLANTARAARRASCCCDAPDVHRRPRGRHGESHRGRGASHRIHVCRRRPLARLPLSHADMCCRLSRCVHTKRTRSPSAVGQPNSKLSSLATTRPVGRSNSIARLTWRIQLRLSVEIKHGRFAQSIDSNRSIIQIGV